ncbi:ArsR/SmtB family transcription factor [Coralliovum pocilloporae]|uniref:ArsR/SmtB family transcription factor n=1 Tax=Coralliovum pocilloporae TaxID=3066369 RepID=UPI0033071665
MDTPLPQLFAALADPTRFAIIERLRENGEQHIGQISEPFQMSAPAISRHIKILEQAGLVKRRTEQQKRFLSLRRECFSTLDDWIRHYREFWNDSFDRLDNYLEIRTNSGNHDATDKP